MDRVVEAAVTTVEKIIRYVVDVITAERVLENIIRPALEQIKKQFETKVNEILKPHLHGQPITYNHSLPDNFQKAQIDRNREAIESKLRMYFELKDSETTTNSRSDVKNLADSLAGAIKTDMDRLSCSMATDMMLAYYKVSSSPSRYWITST